MIIIPNYQITSEILELISKIDSLQHLFSSFEIPQQVKTKIYRASLLKSSLFSARIEGNPLTMEDIDATNKNFRKKEVFNIVAASRYIEKKIKKGQQITNELILNLHALVMKDIHAEAGRFRKKMGAIFNDSGFAIYLFPSPEKIKPLMKQLMNYLNSKKEIFPFICGLIAHLAFEKVHPFIDGSGRVGRLLIKAVLKSKGHNLSIFIPFEEYIDAHKSQYYRVIEHGLKEPQRYLFFMLEAYHEQAKKIKQELFQEMQKKETILLPPRQEELYYVIKDHRLASIDFLRRRFLKVPERTLRYDLKKLTDKGLVIKIGQTKGSYYRIK